MNDAARRRLARGVFECAAYVPCLHVNAPAEVLVEGIGSAEHRVHVCDGVHAPAAEVLVKGATIFEHIPHGSDTRGVPCADVVVKPTSDGRTS